MRDKAVAKAGWNKKEPRNSCMLAELSEPHTSTSICWQRTERESDG